MIDLCHKFVRKLLVLRFLQELQEIDLSLQKYMRFLKFFVVDENKKAKKFRIK